VALAFAVLAIKERGTSPWIERADLGRFLAAGLTGLPFTSLASPWA
jgi:hypothetical protein